MISIKGLDVSFSVKDRKPRAQEYRTKTVDNLAYRYTVYQVQADWEMFSQGLHTIN